MANIDFDRSRPPAPQREESVQIPSQRDLAFKTFGPMETGKQTRSSVVTSLVLNGIALLLVLFVTVTAKKLVTNRPTTQTLTYIPNEPPPLPKPKLPPPPKVKVPPPPKVKVPEVVVQNPPKVQPVITRPAPKPAVDPAPKMVNPAPAPKITQQLAQAASVPNHDVHPTPIRLGNLTNPINNTQGPAVSPINLGRSGAPGMNAANNGFGPPSKISLAGSGSPNGSMGGRDNAAQPIRGLANGIPGGTGSGSGAGARPVGVNIASNNPPARPIVNQPTSPTGTKSAPKVLFKPKPDYTEEARSMHLEGTVMVKIHVSASGAISVVGVQRGLGHGLDESALRAVQAMRFQPAMEAGQPTDWDGVVSIAFQLAS